MRANIRGHRPRRSAASIDRRTFLGSLGAGAAATVIGGGLGAPSAPQAARAEEIAPVTGDDRRQAAFQVRVDAATLAFNRPVPAQGGNGDEAAYPSRIGNYSKGLPHNALGEVDRSAYDLLLAALASGDPDDFEAIPMGLGRRLTNPQSGLAFDLEGPDSQQMALPAAPSLSSAEEAAEAGELYWMAHLRDVSFTRFDTERLVREAADDLSRFSDFQGPKEGGRVTPTTLFRGNTPGDLSGPYLSQFLLKDVPYGSQTISQRQQTVLPGDYLTDYASWLRSQDGGSAGPFQADPRSRYIRNGRDLTHYVHLDALYQAYLNACLILLGLGAPLDPGNPYGASRTQIGFGTYGGPHILTLVTEVATRALKCVWYQKWFVHRRLRPEEFGGRVHNRLTGATDDPIHPDLLNSAAVDRSFSKHGSYLLPQAYPEGCPTHPSYGSGHATVAGACVTILKAWFDESFVLPAPVVANEEGTALIPYRGRDAEALTVGGELNKVAANIATARNMAGIHWRTDFIQSVKLGEAVAIGILEEQKATYNERASFTLTRFDGTTVTI
jgi:hypothetical protein